MGDEKSEDERPAGGILNDPEEYARCSAPHETKEAAAKALNDFVMIVNDARARLRIANFVCSATVTTPEGEALLGFTMRGNPDINRKQAAVLHGYLSHDDADMVSMGREIRRSDNG